MGIFCSWVLVFTGGLSAQSGTVTTDENFRAQPNGTLLGQLYPGAVLDVLDVSDDWVQFELGGWVWIRSLQVVGRGEFDLVVSTSEGENIRTTPSGEVVGHLTEGTLLQEVERVPGWVRVRRSAWIWSPSVEIEGPAPGEFAGAADVVADEWIISGEADAAILSTPDGDTLAAAVPGANLRILAREGNWARVRLDGWLWLPEGTTLEGETAVLTDVSIQDVADSPLEYRGRVLQWDVQFISLERAEKIRTDFYEGEPFLLTKTGRGEGVFVYVAIPPERISEAEGLTPLERIRVVGRVRTGAATLTGSPILELLAFSTIPR
jgi:hypothetical protein